MTVNMLRPQFLNMNFHNFLETVPIFIFRTAPGSFRYRKHSWEKLPVNTILTSIYVRPEISLYSNIIGSNRCWSALRNRFIEICFLCICPFIIIIKIIVRIRTRNNLKPILCCFLNFRHFTLQSSPIHNDFISTQFSTFQYLIPTNHFFPFFTDILTYFIDQIAL